MPEIVPLPPDYAAWVAELKTRAHTAQQRETLAETFCMSYALGREPPLAVRLSW